MSEFDIFDKVLYEYVNYNKPIEYVGFLGGGSGVPTMRFNDSKTGVITEIRTVILKGYHFHDDEYNSEGHYEVKTVEYNISGHDKYLSARDLKKI